MNRIHNMRNRMLASAGMFLAVFLFAVTVPHVVPAQTIPETQPESTSAETQPSSEASTEVSTETGTKASGEASREGELCYQNSFFRPVNKFIFMDSRLGKSLFFFIIGPDLT